MAFYTFKCENCENELEVMCQPSNLHKIAFDDGELKDRCSCGKALKRVYKPIGMGLDIYKNDPSSNGYWKRGKTNGDIANILNDTKANPY